MYPVVIGNGRNLQTDAVIFGYHVPKGVSIEMYNDFGLIYDYEITFFRHM